MYKEILRSLDDAGIFALVAIVIFFVFFVGLIVYVIKMKKSYVNQMASMPMEQEGELAVFDNRPGIGASHT